MKILICLIQSLQKYDFIYIILDSYFFNHLYMYLIEIKMNNNLKISVIAKLNI